jgi:hypothetical protein
MVVQLRPEYLEHLAIDNLRFTVAMRLDCAATGRLPTVCFPSGLLYRHEYLERLCGPQGSLIAYGSGSDNG